MNAYIATLRSAFDEYMSELKRAVQGLSEAEIYYQPTPHSNHIGWLVWHMARVEDMWVNRFLRGADEEWHAGGWDRKLGMESETKVARHTMEEVRAMPHVPMGDLLSYYDAVRAHTHSFLDIVSEDDLEREHEHSSRGKVTGSWVVGHVIVEESQHTGQVAFIRGMMRGFNQ